MCSFVAENLSTLSLKKLGTRNQKFNSSFLDPKFLIFNYALLAKTSTAFSPTLIHLAGHFSAHFLHFIHLDWSMTAKSFCISIAWTGQTRVQSVQPIQPAEQTLLTIGPFQCELQATTTSAAFGISVKIPFGQLATQAPQPTHLLTSTFGKPSSPIDKAPKLQTLTQVPRPMQPNGHEFGEPPGIVAALRQSLMPS